MVTSFLFTDSVVGPVVVNINDRFKSTCIEANKIHIAFFDADPVIIKFMSSTDAFSHYTKFIKFITGVTTEIKLKEQKNETSR